MKHVKLFNDYDFLSFSLGGGDDRSRNILLNTEIERVIFSNCCCCCDQSWEDRNSSAALLSRFYEKKQIFDCDKI